MKTKGSSHVKKILILCICALSVYCVSFFIPSAGELSIYDDVIRLHVIANSDDGRDQEEKMRVRDAVLDTVSEIIRDAETKSEAEEMILSSLDEIEASAGDTLVRDGFDDAVTVTLSNEKYPRRVYGAVTLPAGTYTSLRVMIGDADGANFWCVLFPRLCTAPAIAEAYYQRDGQHRTTLPLADTPYQKTAGAKKVLSTDACVGCGLCQKLCPAGAITVSDKHSIADESLCLSCGLCAVRCPKGAIPVPF